VDAAAHGAQQTRSVGAVVPGGTVQLVPVAQREPTPVQLRHTRPSVSVTSEIASPQATVVGAGHAGQHAPSRHVAPVSQRVPRPGQGSPPAHVSGMAAPQATSLAPRQTPRHSQTPPTQLWPRPHAPSQRPPQPSGAPHAAPASQEGTHSQSPVSGLHSSPGSLQGPMQKPPQPSGAPHAASAGQLRTHVHVPPMQRSGAVHSGSHPQVAMQRPLLQTSPLAQVTPAHGFTMHAPARQNCPSGQVTPSHADRGVQVKWHAAPSPHRASQGEISAQRPRAGSQNWPDGQLTPSHATGRQPGKQSPSMQVSSAPHTTPRQGSTVATQRARHRSPVAHGSPSSHGSG
jgi:hypothetical protein